MNKQSPQIGRVLRANTTGFVIGCRVAQLSIPAFGGLVKALPLGSGEAIYGLIYDMHIDDDALVRRLVLAESPRPEFINDQRENRMLPIEMSVVTVGYQLNGKLRQSLPPRPPLNLDPVFVCSDVAEVTQFTDSLSYLRLILRTADSGVPVDQLLVSHIAAIYDLRGQDDQWALRVIAELTELLRSNYEMLIPTLEALSDALPDLEGSKG